VRAASHVLAARNKIDPFLRSALGHESFKAEEFLPNKSTVHLNWSYELRVQFSIEERIYSLKSNHSCISGLLALYIA
jgi:hypothetical protein